MPSSQDLVPTNQPYGERQRTVAGMQAANVPLSSEGGGSDVLAPSATPSPRGVAAPATAELQSFDVLAGREPTPDFQPIAPRQVAFERIRQSPNRVMQAIAERMDGYKEG